MPRVIRTPPGSAPTRKGTNTALRALVCQFARSGTDALESTAVLRTPDVVAAGGLAALQLMGKPPAELLFETKERVFTA